MSENPIIGFQVDPADIQYIGQDLQRPECILAEPDGTLWSADARGGVVRISADGSQQPGRGSPAAGPTPTRSALRSRARGFRGSKSDRLDPA